MSEDTTKYVFQTPNSPEEFGVVLPLPELRRLDFSALDYQTMLRAGIEYIRTYHPNDFNDFFASNGLIMTLELVSFLANVVTERGDIIADESYIPTAQTKEAVSQHLALINQQIEKATPATVDVQVTVANQLTTELRITPGVIFSFAGPDGQPVYYEVFRAPGDFTSDISIPPGKRGVVAFGIEGKFGSDVSVVSNGGTDQFIDITGLDVLDAPIFVTVQTGADTPREWQRVDIIEKSKPQDEVFEVVVMDNGVRIKFGNNIAGKAPLAGEQIVVRYRNGGGVRGRIGANIINETRSYNPTAPVSAAVDVLFRNPTPSQGGTDEETIEDAKKRAPKEFATHESATTGEDYSVLASTYSHPVFGSVAKAIGTIRTGIEGDPTTVVEQIRAAPTVSAGVQILLNEYVNRNIVEVYVLAEGSDGTPVKPNTGLKTGLISFFSEINVLTDEIRILDGQVKYVDVQAVIVMSRNADAGTVKVGVNAAIIDFFNIDNWDMGTPLYLSNLYDVISNVPGVKYANIFKPDDNIILVSDLSSASGVRFNEVIALGNVDLKFYFEQGSFKTPPVGQRNLTAI